MKDGSWSIDFETRSGSDIDLGLPRYFADPDFKPLCLKFMLPEEIVVGWEQEQGMDFSTLEPLFEHVRNGGLVRGWNVMFEYWAWAWCTKNWGWPVLHLWQCVDTMAEAAAMNLPQSLGKCGPALGLPQDKVKDADGKALIRLLCCPQAAPEVRPANEYKLVATYKAAQTRLRKWEEAGGRWRNDPQKLRQLYDYCGQDVVSEYTIANGLRRLSEYEQRVWIKTQEINLRGVPVAVEEVAPIAHVVAVESERLNARLERLTAGEVTAGSQRKGILDWINERMEPVATVEVVTLRNDIMRVNYALPEGVVEEFDGKVVIKVMDVDDLEPHLLAEVGKPGSHRGTRPFLTGLDGDQVEAVIGKLQARERTPTEDTVLEVLQTRARVAQTSTAKLPKMVMVACPQDVTLKMMLAYHGASTGRYASRGGINLQNLVRPKLSGGDIAVAHDILAMGDHDIAHMLWGERTMDAAVACIRGVLKAPPGYEFIDADFSSVENRVGVWLAGQNDKLEMFRAGLDEYKVFASQALYGVPYDQVTKDMRQMSKSAVLGCLFGQGWFGLIEYAKGYGVTLKPSKSKEVVKLYREEYAEVQKCWWACGDAMVDAVRHPGVVFEVGLLKFVVHKDFLWLKLPSGRAIAWYQPRLEMRRTPWGADKETVTTMGVNSVTKQWQRSVLLGSSAFQSGVQGTARDLQVNGVLNCEAAGYKVVLLVHDEQLSLVKQGWGDVNEYGSLMCKAPTWAGNLPLAFEGWRGMRFQK